jgi:hypothetical protein
MKGAILFRDFLIFVAELILVFLTLYWVVSAGSFMMENVVGIDSRILQDSLAGLEGSAEISPNYFKSTMNVPGNEYTLTFGTDMGYYYFHVHTGQKIVETEAGKVRVPPTQKIFFAHMIGNDIIDYLNVKMEKGKKNVINIEKTVDDKGNKKINIGVDSDG